MCQNAETESYPSRNPQPVKLAEKRSDALRTPDGEYKSSSGVENGLQVSETNSVNPSCLPSGPYPKRSKPAAIHDCRMSGQACDG